MKDFIKTINMCLSMFTTLYVPYKNWDEKLRCRMLSVFPFVGIYIGFIFIVLSSIIICFVDNINIYIVSLVISLYPYFVTGFIHLDGFMDVEDALSSYSDYDKMIKILKDSHVGSFAVIKTIILILAQYISVLTILSKIKIYNVYDFYIVLTLIFITFVISRCMSSIALIKLKKLSISEYAEDKKLVGDDVTYKDSECGNNDFIKCFFIKKAEADMPVMILIMTIICSIFINIFLISSVILTIKIVSRILVQSVIIIIAHIVATYRCYKNFRGVNGDVSGYAICIAECVSFIFISLI